MTTLAANSLRDDVLGGVSAYAVIASDIIWPGAAVGLVDASGHAQPLAAADKFVGFARKKADNSAGSAADINVEVDIRGTKVLSVSGAVITDVGNPVFATDDNVFVFSPVGGVFIGVATRFVSSGIMEVTFDAQTMHAGYPYDGRIWEVFSADATLAITDTSKGLWMDTDTKVATMLTYAAATAMDVVAMNGGAFGTVAAAVDVAAGDVMSGPDDTGAGGGISTNTKTTARRGDFIHVSSGGDDGYIIVGKKGIWTIA
jgi:hypothetical protein